MEKEEDTGARAYPVVVSASPGTTAAHSQPTRNTPCGGQMLKLSEAIRLGAMLKPQSFGSMRSCEAVPSLGDVLGLRIIEKTCAMGAAYEAGYRSAPYLGVSTCPACVHVGPVPYLVMHLNDSHRWTRERIADWVESVERAQEPTPVVECETVAAS